MFIVARRRATFRPFNMTDFSVGDQHQSGMNTQREFAAYFAISLVMLVCSIVFSNYVAHHRHWVALPEAGGLIGFHSSAEIIVAYNIVLAMILVGMAGGTAYLIHTSTVTQSVWNTFNALHN